MSDSQVTLLETADRLFGDLASRSELDLAAIWEQLNEAGFPSLLVSEGDGGFGGDWLDAVAVLRLAGYHALPGPLAEAIIAARLNADAGFAWTDGSATIAPCCDGKIKHGSFSGRVSSVPWGRMAETVTGVCDGQLIRLRRADAEQILCSQNPVGEPRDTLLFENAVVVCGIVSIDPFMLGALARTAMIAGALDMALARSVAYANERVQFGKPIAKFQAIQQSLAVFAEEAAAVNCAVQAAACAMERREALFEIAAAKLRANMAAGIGAATAHQIHGAIGFSWEYDLHRWTRRLVSWSSEFGSERYWAEFIGGQVSARGPEAFWSDLTKRSD